ncbi:MAG: hypothetical protein ABR921_06320 [Candidatus Sulfotelmatobacter sp.]
MPFARVDRIARLAAAVLSATLTIATTLATLTVAVWAQDAPAAPAPQSTSEKPLPVLNYTHPVSHFPNPIGPYTPRRLAPPNLANTGRIDQLMHEGKLYLSLNDAIALALENNLDIAIARYNMNIADTDILRARAGAQTLGVNTGIVQNTPGGGVGGLGGQVGSGTGGTSLGASGAGAGAGGLVGSTLGLGSLITSFDPILTGTLQEDHFTILPSSTFSPASPQNTTTGNFTYQQGFSWGTNLLVGFNNTRVATANAPFSPLSPQLNSSFRLQLTQHLLQGLGFAANNRFIRIAKNDRELSDVAFRLQVITTRAHRSGARPEHYVAGPTRLDGCPHQPGAGAVADEERAQPHAARSNAGRSRSDPHLNNGTARERTGAAHGGFDRRRVAPSRRSGGATHPAQYHGDQQQSGP